MNRRANPFRRSTVLAMLAVASISFVLALYAIGAGLDGRDERNGGAHAASTGLNGFAGLAELLEKRGHEVSLSRSPARLEDEALLVVTPQHFADGEEIWELIISRRYTGPTLVILPKWYAMAIPQEAGAKAEPGWVILGTTGSPEWVGSMGLDKFDPQIGKQRSWRGLGLTGSFPDADRVQSMSGAGLVPLVRSADGKVLAGYWNNNGYYPVLDEAAGLHEASSVVDGGDEDAWPVVFISEPDLLNNYGLADEQRARAAVALIDATLEEYDLPIVFDLTIPGLGRSENLLTLAFRPPFLAATLCLLLAAIVIAWRAFRRFGPPSAPQPAMAMGKRQLARNGAALIERARRLHLLGPPYAAMLGARLARALAIRDTDPQRRDSEIERVLATRGLADLDYRSRADALRNARHPGELLRAAGALKSIERIVTP